MITYKGWPIHLVEVEKGRWSATISAPVGFIAGPGEGEAVEVYGSEEEAIGAAKRLIDETLRRALGGAP